MNVGKERVERKLYVLMYIHLSPNFASPPLPSPLSSDIDIGEWQEQTDSSRLRDLNYTVALNYSFGPKFSPTIEHQVYSSTGQPGLKHLVHTEVCPHCHAHLYIRVYTCTNVCILIQMRCTCTVREQRHEFEIKCTYMYSVHIIHGYVHVHVHVMYM